MLQNGGRLMRELVAQCADEGAGVHGGLKAFTADVAYYDEHGIVFERRDLEKVASNTVGGQVGAFEHEVAIGWQLRGNEQGLNAARGFDFCGGALLVLTDVNEAVQDDGDDATEEDEVGDSAGVVLDRSEVIAMRHEVWREPVAAGNEVEQDVDGVGGGCQEEREQHDASFRTSTAPCAPEHDDNDGAEEELRDEREISERLLKMEHGSDGQQKYS